MENIIVTGGAGFIGSHLCDLLLKSKKKVICVDNLLTGNAENIAHLRSNENFQFLEFDVINPLPENITADAVFHLASPASPNHHSPISYHNLPMQTMLANTTGTLELLKFAERNKARFLYTSTSEVYGDPLEHPQKEDYRGNVSTTGPRSVYDEAKRFGETIVAHFWRKGVDARIARIFNTYGPKMRMDDKRMIVDFIYNALYGDPINIFGDGTQTRSLCYVEDTVEGLMRLMFYPNTNTEVVNIGSEEECTVLEYAKLVKELTVSESEIKSSEDLPKDDPKQRRPDISKAKALLGWEPKVKLEEGLRMMIDHLKEGHKGKAFAS